MRKESLLPGQPDRVDQWPQVTRQCICHSDMSAWPERSCNLDALLEHLNGTDIPRVQGCTLAAGQTTTRM